MNPCEDRVVFLYYGPFSQNELNSLQPSQNPDLKFNQEFVTVLEKGCLLILRQSMSSSVKKSEKYSSVQMCEAALDGLDAVIAATGASTKYWLVGDGSLCNLFSVLYF